MAFYVSSPRLVLAQIFKSHAYCPIHETLVIPQMYYTSYDTVDTSGKREDCPALQTGMAP